ncbi:PAS domain-containing protein [Piscinibacter sp.]|mgnify:FL=1|uniref:PAS domain-containing protein n=1 Tax=Piscinibacter sp. TaxID=1903157 RepID=UPI001D3DFCF7|nr:PAS domain-containing protein [Piscinibacter sp.]MBK7529097.1 PAS domain-containing protein [Piscinibacter sp.]MBL0093876.1 PAS domain-containing protein [Piscinibacter sp.]
MNQRSGGADDLGALAPWAQELAQTFVTLSSDIALVLDDAGVITSVAQAGKEPISPAAAHWIGRPWVETVSGGTRRKVEALLQDVTSTGLARRREVNHPGAGGTDIPIAYTAIRLGRNGPVIAVGRDMRAIAAIQQRFLDAQQDLERGYWRARQAETHERQLLQVLTDAVLVVDAATLTIVSANRTASNWLATSGALVGQSVEALFDTRSRSPIHQLLVTARSSGRPVELRARLLGNPVAASVAATPFRATDVQRLLVRMRTTGAPAAAVPGAALREAAAVTDSVGNILSCDAAFVALMKADDDGALIGKSVAQWLGEPADELAALLQEVRHAGLAERTAVPLRVADSLPVQLSATWLTEGDQECIGLVLRQTPPRLAEFGEAQVAFAQAWTRLCDQLGTASLPDMLRDATALAEQHFIRMALERASGDTVTAAGLLGVSPQSLRRPDDRKSDSP